jgi:hypothetical protein
MLKGDLPPNAVLTKWLFAFLKRRIELKRGCPFICVEA